MRPDTIKDWQYKAADFSTIARFEDKWISVEPFGCWEWQGHVNRYDYGVFYVAGSTVGAHRYSWVLHNGLLVSSLDVDHFCRNHMCVNPDHLSAMTHIENLSGPKPALHIKNCPQGHDYDEKNTYITKLGHRGCRACARRRMKEKNAGGPGALTDFKHPQSKLNADQYEKLFNLANSKKYTQKQLSEIFNVNQSNISRILSGDRYKNVKRNSTT